MSETAVAEKVEEPVAEPEKKDKTKSAETRDYHVLILKRAEDGTSQPVWQQLGVVTAVSADAARLAILTEHGLSGGTLVAVPARSWNPERYATKQEPPKFVKETGPTPKEVTIG